MAFSSSCAACSFSEVVSLQSSCKEPQRRTLATKGHCSIPLVDRACPSPIRRPVPERYRSAKRLRSQRRCRAAASGDEASTSDTPAKRYVRRPKVKVPEADPNLRTYAVEDENVVVEGVAKIDRGEETMTFGRLALLVAGDTVALLLFALAGKVSHTGTADFGVLPTAAPFLVGWFASATLSGGYGVDATLSGPLKGATTAGTAWAVGIPLGIVIRGVLKGQVPPTPFILVTLASTFVLLVGWRAALAATAGKKDGGDRSGSPFEFLELLSSLVRRW